MLRSSAIGIQTPNTTTSTTTTFNTILLFSFSNTPKPHSTTTTTTPSSSLKPLLLATTNASPSSSSPEPLRHATSTLPDVEEPRRERIGDGEEEEMVPSASAVALAIQKSSTSPVEFVQRIKKSDAGSKLVLPSPDFQRLCRQQLDLFRRIVQPGAILSVYVRPAGSYVMDRLELRRVTYYPEGNAAADVVILVGNFNVPTGLRAAEAALSSQQVQILPEHRAIVFPMVKQPFVVGFLVAELPMMQLEKSCLDVPNSGRELIHLPSPEEAYDLHQPDDMKVWGIQTPDDETLRMHNFATEQRLNAIDISHSLAMAYVMDQKALLLQQSSWQNNVRMGNLVEQIRGPLSSIQTLSKMLSTHVKRSEISYDIAEDILVQGDRISDTLQELQDAVYLTKANIMRYNEETLKRISNSTHEHPELVGSHLLDNFARDTDHKFQSSGPFSFNTSAKHLEIPVPPLDLAPLQHGIRPCNVSEVLSDLVDAVRPLAHNHQCSVEFNELSQPFQVAVEEPAVRQALSNLIEGALLRTHVGGKVEIVYTVVPAGVALVVIDDDGPDMHYMTQMHSLTPFGAELQSENMVEDNMAWNFVAGLTVAREILEGYGCVVRVISPRITDAAVGAGGTRIELWLPSFAALSDPNGHTHEA